jgi:TNF receptor-associated protein 1
VKTTTRLSDSPAIITDHESGALRRMMKMLNQANMGNKTAALPPQMLEINPSHKMIVALAQAQGEGEKSAVAKLVAEQILDNALIAAGLVDDPRMMLSRLNEILVATLTK